MSEFPQLFEYQSALQHPDIAFRDPVLKPCAPVRNAFGLPEVDGGAFALTYKLQGAGVTWAVRCFKQEVPDRKHRYAAIQAFIDNLTSHPTHGVTSREAQRYFTPIHFESEGIHCASRWLPITRMRWIDGVPLNTYVEQHVHEPERLQALLDQFLVLVAWLQDLGVAHGDLQHGNVLVEEHQLRLVDYDGMYLPELRHLGSAEAGHPNYQHPARTDPRHPHPKYDSNLDRFSVIVIFLALRSLALHPNLWERHGKGGESLLFQRKDFIKPFESLLLKDLASIHELQNLVPRFQAICQGSLDNVPTITDFLSGEFIAAAATRQQYVEVKPYDVEAASDCERLKQRWGERIEVIGKVETAVSSITELNTPCAFLNFGDWKNGAFVVVLWSECLDMFHTQGRVLRAYNGKWVSITGVIEMYEVRPGVLRPEIILRMPSQIEIVDAHELDRRRNIQTALPFVQAAPPSPLPSKDDHVNSTPSTERFGPYPWADDNWQNESSGSRLIIGSSLTRDAYRRPIVSGPTATFKGTDTLAFALSGLEFGGASQVIYEILKAEDTASRKVYGNVFTGPYPCGVLGPLNAYVYSGPGKYTLRLLRGHEVLAEASFTCVP